MKTIVSVILAAGKGKRMKSSLPKVLHSIAGQPMLAYSFELCKKLGIKKKIVVVGHQADKIKEKFIESDDELIYAFQEEQLGTAHAVLQTKKHLIGFPGLILVLSADVPLLRPSTIQNLINYHNKHQLNCTLLTANLMTPEGYGRIIRNKRGEVNGIIEQSDISGELGKIKEVNTGIYCFDSRELFKSLDLVSKNNYQNEYYLTDLIKIFIEKGYAVGGVTVADNEEIIGVNTRSDLSRVTQIAYHRNAIDHMNNGITIVDAASAFIDNKVKIGQDSIICPFTVIESGSEIGNFCHIGPYSHVINSKIGSKTEIYSSIVENSQIGDYCKVGPYSHIRPDSIIGNNVKIGNYVEVKKSLIEDGTKIGHLSYIGDAKISWNVNIGAGTITCNYDGQKKNPTVIEEGVFIGSNNALVAPVTIGRHSYTAAGSTITQNVPAESLGIARSRQKNIRNWVRRSKRETK